MNATPRTDALLASFGNIDHEHELARFEWLARELERENAQLREDKARIDWLEANSADLYEIHGKWYIYPDDNHPSPGIRAAIDAARKAT